MTAGQSSFPVARSIFDFKQHGKSGIWVSELLPHFSKIVDDVTVIKSMYTEAINHEPAISAMQTGNQITGRPCLGSWASYGLGTMNENLPTFVVLVAIPSNREQEQAIVQQNFEGLGTRQGSGRSPEKGQGTVVVPCNERRRVHLGSGKFCRAIVSDRRSRFGDGRWATPDPECSRLGHPVRVLLRQLLCHHLL